ncbi:TIGR02594 family protein [Variovorax sp. LjRoot290]|uniref:TIGR02594 family protein n=1 Tax=Variovorax sp. LjRoot290 TaxID=3342316 RepID=UPI003ED09FFC
MGTSDKDSLSTAVLTDGTDSQRRLSFRKLASWIAIVVTVVAGTAAFVKNVDTIWTTASGWFRGKPQPTPGTEIKVTAETLVAIADAMAKTAAAKSGGAASEEVKKDSANLKSAAKEIEAPLSVGTAAIPAPPWLKLALAELGQSEIPGPESNPRILEYIHSSPHFKNVTDDTMLPWSALFLNWVMKASGVPGVDDGRNIAWLTWGSELKEPKQGAVAIFKRPESDASPSRGQAYSCLYLGQTATYILCLGGNVGNAVRITSRPKENLVGYRWPPA